MKYRFFVYGEKKGVCKQYDITANSIKQASKRLDEEHGETVWSAIDSNGKTYTDEEVV